MSAAPIRPDPPPSSGNGNARNGGRNGSRNGGIDRQRLRPLRAPTPIRVTTGENGLPCSLERRGRSFRIEAVRERWRIDDEWWRHPISREYFALVLEDGRPVILFRDLTTGEWYGQ